MVMRDQVRSLWKKRIVAFQESALVTFLMKSFFCNSLGNVFKPGTWKLSVVDLKRYGRGGFEDMV
jgi:hypothetical protein